MTQPEVQAERSVAQGAAFGDGFSHEPLRARVAAVLRAAILDGSLPPGAPLIEKAIAEDLEISRAPVREAIRMLSQEGLVESVAYKGSRVRVPSSRDVIEVYSIRGLLERFAVRRILASSGSGGDSLATLCAVCDAMEQRAAADDLRGVSAEDERFHRTLIELADHELLLDLWSHIALRARHIMGLRNAQLRDARQVAANHRTIVAALASGDLEETLRLVSGHIDAGAQLILDDWQGPS